MRKGLNSLPGNIGRIATVMLVGILHGLGGTAAYAEPAKIEELPAEEFFERRVRPVLVEHCQPCHGATKQEAGLRLDSAESLRKGSDSGPVIVSSAPTESPLLEAIRYDGPVKMPPRGKLPDAAIQALTAWVSRGALWPKADPPGQPTEKTAAAGDGKRHWAFQPVQSPPLPAVRQSDWVRTPVDAFILAKLEQAGMTPSPPADKRTWLRRVTFDLIGLPPTPEVMTAFELDESPQAREVVVERLLASPRYGERWGRHWLDVARYSDTKGYVRLKENPVYPCAWTYRDYVIRAFNEDLPYDRFLLEQLAADQLVTPEDQRPLAAMGFLTLGERFINSQHDIIDDRIDVVTRGLMGITVTCARCHNHKFDPVPTEDYYSLHGIFSSSFEPRVPPLILPPAERPRFAAYLQGLDERMAKFQEFLATQHTRLVNGFRARAGDYLLAAQGEQVQDNFLAVMFLVDATKDLNPVMLQRWARFLAETRKRHHPVLAPWHALAKLPGAELSHRLPELLVEWSVAKGDDGRCNPRALDALARHPLPVTLPEVAARYGELFHEAEQRWQSTVREQPAARGLAESSWEEIRELLYGPASPVDFPLTEIEDFFFVDATVQNQFHEQQRLVEDWIGSPTAAPHALILQDLPEPVEPRVFLRGNPSNPGKNVPRQFLAVLSAADRQPFQQGSGRLELARAIANSQNPLTARVLVNRVWMHHFGLGLVRTPGDFGMRGEPPTHPELLDYLAAQFTNSGWSIKSLHRLMVLSATYQQASGSEAKFDPGDPENLLLGHMNRRRLDWEALRDSLIAVSGKLDTTMGGPAVELNRSPFSYRRSVYGVVDRLNLPSVLRTFDFASPESSRPQRHQTTVPQQALFLMNSPFIEEQVRNLSSREEFNTQPSVDQRIDALYPWLFGRRATDEERRWGRDFMQSASEIPTDASPSPDRKPPLTSWQEYLQTLLLTNEFVFVD